MLLSLVGCASTVQKISNDTQADLTNNMGYALIPIYRNTAIHQIRISGEKYIQFDALDLKNEMTYSMIPLPAGQYRYDEIRLNKYTVIDDFDINVDHLGFEIRAGVVNYVGHLIVNNHSNSSNTYRLSYEIQNNSSIALEHLEKHYPNIIEKYNVIYNGPGTDDFFSFAKSITSIIGEE